MFLLVQGCILRFHVSFPGCSSYKNCMLVGHSLFVFQMTRWIHTIFQISSSKESPSKSSKLTTLKFLVCWQLNDFFNVHPPKNWGFHDPNFDGSHIFLGMGWVETTNNSDTCCWLLRVFLDFQEAGRTLGPFFELQLLLQEVVNLFPPKFLQSPQGNQGGGFKDF